MNAKQSCIHDDKLIEKVISLLDAEIRKNPNAEAYGFSINYFEFKDKIIINNLELLKNYYNNKDFEVFFEDDSAFGVRKIKLRRRQ